MNRTRKLTLLAAMGLAMTVCMTIDAQSIRVVHYGTTESTTPSSTTKTVVAKTPATTTYAQFHNCSPGGMTVQPSDIDRGDRPDFIADRGDRDDFAADRTDGAGIAVVGTAPQLRFTPAHHGGHPHGGRHHSPPVILPDPPSKNNTVRENIAALYSQPSGARTIFSR